MAKDKKRQRRTRVKRGIRKKLYGTAERPRLSVYRSNLNIYAQLIDDKVGYTLASASSLNVAIEGTKPVELSRVIGEKLAEQAKSAGIKKVVFDRNGYRYHGRVKALAEGARNGGLEF